MFTQNINKICTYDRNTAWFRLSKIYQHSHPTLCLTNVYLYVYLYTALLYFIYKLALLKFTNKDQPISVLHQEKYLFKCFDNSLLKYTLFKLA